MFKTVIAADVCLWCWQHLQGRIS